jgi:hypothetical protein
MTEHGYERGAWATDPRAKKSQIEPALSDQGALAGPCCSC